ncbi:MAG TPA: alpha-glucuronidase family glycosyl hydrolase, partial [Draconibacterium sp.]|nr:alpha-glucuronidase family glycosyl hydrolase [Draconibacterium sp.]
MNKIIKNILLIVSLFTLLCNYGYSQSIDLSNATIVNFEKTDRVVLKAVNVLQEEVAKRTSIKLPVSSKLIKTAKPLMLVGLESQLGLFPAGIQNTISMLPSIQKEGFKIVVIENSKMVAIVGADARGALYGIGKLLRTVELQTGKITVPSDFKIASSPQYPIRGHQLGYRPKTNAYDAWTPVQFDQYIRDLAIFGTNSIEIMPPRTDDDFTSVHMKLPAIEMIAEQSKICDSYGMDVWMWYPNMGSDYSNSDSLKKEIAERHLVFKAVPRLDALFVPGGDPGELEPDVLFGWIEKEAEILHQYHPNAKIWVSPQVFKPSKEWYAKFYELVNKKYDWFGGIVYGPWIRTPLPEVKTLIDPSIPIRLYPDITHSIS